MRLGCPPRIQAPTRARRARSVAPACPGGQRRPEVDRIRSTRSRTRAASTSSWRPGGPGAGSDGARSAAGPICSGRPRGSRRGSSRCGGRRRSCRRSERGGVAAVAAITFTGDQIDEGRFLSLLLNPSRSRRSRIRFATLGAASGAIRRGGAGQSRGGFREYRCRFSPRQEGKNARCCPKALRSRSHGPARPRSELRGAVIALSSMSRPPPT